MIKFGCERTLECSGTCVSAALFDRLLLSPEEVPQWHVQDDQPLHVTGTAGKRGSHGCKHLGTVSLTFIRALKPDFAP